MDVFFHFPEDLDENKNIISSIKDILMFLKKNPDCNLFYSADNINEFKNSNEETEVYLTDEIKILRQFFHSSRVKKISHTTSSTIYNRWNLKLFKVSPCDETLSNIATKKYLDADYNCILINLESGIDFCRSKILIFRDCIHLDYPDHFVKIDFVTNYVEFQEWFKTNHVKTFSLRDESKFQKMSSIKIKGATAYFEKSQNRYWHLDTLHNNIEYEVYNSLGIHIATADENGTLNLQGKVNGRTITIS